MRKKAGLFLGSLVVLSAAGLLLRALELRTALDLSTMLMDFAPASLLLLILSALTLGLMAFMARSFDAKALPGSYNRCFGGVGTLAVSAAALVMMLAGMLLCLRDRGADYRMRVFLPLLALTAALAGAAWLALGLDGWRKKEKDSFLSAVLPVVFCGLFLIVYYKHYAQMPALLYVLYPFLGLCASLLALHLLAGFTLKRPARSRLCLFFCGAGCYLSIVSIPGVKETAYRLFLAALALELAAHGACLLLPHPPEPEKPVESGEAGAEAPEGAAEEAAGEVPEAEGGGAEETKPE